MKRLVLVTLVHAVTACVIVTERPADSSPPPSPPAPPPPAPVAAAPSEGANPAAADAGAPDPTGFGRGPSDQHDKALVPAPGGK